ncbi:MAG: TonB family protein [Rickettsiales bacterium]
MIRALGKGLLGRDQQSLSGSALALGPNRYLNEMDFLKMMGAALLAHAIVFGIAGLFPHEEVTNIPVRALSFKLGDQDRVAALGASGVGVQMNRPIAAPVMRASSEERWRASANLPTPATPAPLRPVVKTPKTIPVPAELPRQVPRENNPPPAPQPTLAPLPPAVAALPNPALLNQPAIAPTPQQYVREVGAANPALVKTPASASGTATGSATGQGAVNTTTDPIQQIRERYEQQISGWIQLHKVYPASAGGREGRVVVRMRIDRAGAVRYYAIEQSSGIDAIDTAAIDMVRRANPVPAVPENYPAGSLIEFLIPITFHAPA